MTNDKFQVSAFSDLNDLVRSVSKALSDYIDSLPQYLIKEMQHPRKKAEREHQKSKKERMKMIKNLDEAIKHCEEVAKLKEYRVDEEVEIAYSRLEAPTNDMRPMVEIEKLKRDAEYYRQLAEWLRELKIHREIHDVLLQMLVNLESDACCIDLMNDANECKICEENCTNSSKGCWVRWAKLKAREVNANEDSD